MTFWEHLEALRWHIVRMVAYVIVAAAACWVFREQLLSMLRYPAEAGAHMAGVEDFSFRIFEAAGGIILMMQISLVGGLIAASPLIMMELWLFVKPALELHERRYVYAVVPLASFLFLGGVAFCYWIAPKAFAFFFRFNEGLGVEVELTLQPYLYFLMRLLLVFGLSFELPLVLTFLSVVGLVTQARLLSWWRHAIVVILVFAAVATPTTDPATMSFLAAPMIALYLLSVFLAGLVEKRRAPEGLQDAELPDDEEPPVSRPPVG